MQCRAQGEAYRVRGVCGGVAPAPNERCATVARDLPRGRRATCARAPRCRRDERSPGRPKLADATRRAGGLRRASGTRTSAAANRACAPRREKGPGNRARASYAARTACTGSAHDRAADRRRRCKRRVPSSRRQAFSGNIDHSRRRAIPTRWASSLRGSCAPRIAPMCVPSKGECAPCGASPRPATRARRARPQARSNAGSDPPRPDRA
jgi:hypothetical protein